MKKIIFSIVIVVSCVSVFGQKVSKITINRDGSFNMLSLLLDESITITMSNEGTVNAWGIEIYSDRIPSLSKLDPYVGRVEYYTNYDNEAFRGKVKYIGKTLITYYASFDLESLRGKVKTIGSSAISYYTKYENELLNGKIKNVGPVGFNWYTSYDNEALRGKLKTVGATQLNYYTSYDDVAIRGRIKSIDRQQFTYYLSTEKREFQGAVKSGSQLQTINGIKYHVQF